MNTRHRIRAALTGFACGDAAGVPWETMRPEQIEPRRIPSLPDRRGWPRGSVSDDTIFLLSVADVIASGSATPRSLLERLAADLPRARGAGRTSRAAVERLLAHGTLHATGGATNGAAMRALPIGWASATGQAERRVRLGVDLARTTHGEPSAIAAAVAVAAMGAWSIEGEPIDRIIAQALSETRLALDLLGAPPALMTPIESAAKGKWQVPDDGVPFLGMETVAAVVTVLRQAASTEDCIIRAVCLGGDTDTCAAVAAGLHAGATGDDVISWRDDVPLIADPVMARLAEGLAWQRQSV
ncbi:MAG: ADP-ribosylglycohydrolase family protein [Alphaproteobacteria bacterium]|nr:ADP-ribosylglycohydrolase family protein [Alphaproteobacteria bacterium]